MPDGSLIAPGKHLTRAVFASDPPTDDPFEFVLSDETLSRDGNIIQTAGWQLANFRKNPIALFGHRSDFFIGNWTNVRIEGQRLLARLEPMTAVSERLQEIQTAIRERVLRAVSVGWYGIEVEPLDEKDPFAGVRFLKSELVEASVVGVGSNPNALSLARSLNLSRETIGMIFGEPAVRGQSMVRGFSGVPAVTSRTQATQTMSLSEMIQGSEQRLVQLRDNLSNTIQQAGGVMDEAATQMTEEIENEQSSLDNLKRAEKALGNQSEAAGSGQSGSTGTALVPYTGANLRQGPAFLRHKRKDVQPSDYAFRAATVGLLSHITKQPREQILHERYGDDEPTRIVSNMLLRASVPATTTLTGWAAELVMEVVLDLLDVIVPNSVYRALASRGAKFTFGRNGIVTLPARSATPTISGSFIAEGGAIPVRQAAFTSVSLTPMKMAVISTFTSEIMEHSTPQIEGLIRQIMQEDTSSTLDSLLLDAIAGTTTRPAGLRYGVVNTNIVTGGGVTAIVGDIKAMMQSLATNKALRDPVWIMNPVDRVAALLATNSVGEFIFRNEMSQGTLGGFPVITSENVTSGMVLLVNAADFFSATGDEPRFTVSDQATLHMEDTSPTAIVSGGTAASGAVRSLFQTDSLGIRMILPINWTMRRTGGVAWSESVAW